MLLFFLFLLELLEIHEQTKTQHNSSILHQKLNANEHRNKIKTFRVKQNEKFV